MLPLDGFNTPLTRLLGGGVPFGTVLELVGPAGAGKSNLVTTAIVHAILPPPVGMNSSAILIDPERIHDDVLQRVVIARGGP